MCEVQREPLGNCFQIVAHRKKKTCQEPSKKNAQLGSLANQTRGCKLEAESGRDEKEPRGRCKRLACALLFRFCPLLLFSPAATDPSAPTSQRAARREREAGRYFVRSRDSPNQTHTFSNNHANTPAEGGIREEKSDIHKRVCAQKRWRRHSSFNSSFFLSSSRHTKKAGGKFEYTSRHDTATTQQQHKVSVEEEEHGGMLRDLRRAAAVRGVWPVRAPRRVRGVRRPPPLRDGGQAMRHLPADVPSGFRDASHGGLHGESGRRGLRAAPRASSLARAVARQEARHVLRRPGDVQANQGPAGLAVRRVRRGGVRRWW